MDSVTTVLKPWVDFSMIDPDVLNHAAARGTAVHKACTAYAIGYYVPPLSAEIQGYYDSFREWFIKYVGRVYFVETEFINEQLRVVGHPDMGCKLMDGRDMVVDLKTPATTSKTWAPQLAAYLKLAKGYAWDGAMVLQLKANGRAARGIVYQYTDEDYAAFISALNCYRYFPRK
jgi:hypothetical protein